MFSLLASAGPAAMASFASVVSRGPLLLTQAHYPKWSLPQPLASSSNSIRSFSCAWIQASATPLPWAPAFVAFWPNSKTTWFSWAPLASEAAALQKLPSARRPIPPRQCQSLRTLHRSPAAAAEVSSSSIESWVAARWKTFAWVRFALVRYLADRLVLGRFAAQAPLA